MEPVADLMIEAVADGDKELVQEAFDGADVPALVVLLAAKCAYWQHVDKITVGVRPPRTQQGGLLPPSTQTLHSKRGNHDKYQYQRLARHRRGNLHTRIPGTTRPKGSPVRAMPHTIRKIRHPMQKRGFRPVREKDCA